MKKEEKNISIKLFCPQCGNSTKRNSSILIKQYQYLVNNKLPWYAWNSWMDDVLKKKGVLGPELASFLQMAKMQPNLKKLFKQKHFQWACDHCIQTNQAIEGLIEQQTFCDNPPYLAYFDKNKECETCQTHFVFTKEEQKYWYEELKFWVQSIPKNCKECQKKIKAERNLNTHLSNLIKELDPRNAEQLIEISQIYFEIGKIEKGKHYATLANKASKMKN